MGLPNPSGHIEMHQNSQVEIEFSVLYSVSERIIWYQSLPKPIKIKKKIKKYK